MEPSGLKFDKQTGCNWWGLRDGLMVPRGGFELNHSTTESRGPLAGIPPHLRSPQERHLMPAEVEPRQEADARMS